MKVVIVTEGGKSIGFGHLTRCISLYEVFKERGVASELIVNGDDSITDLLRGKNYRIFNWFQEKDKLFKLVKNADVVIVDSYMADNSFYENISKLVETPVYIDDNKRLDYPRGIVVNGNIYAEELDYPKKNGVVYLLGTKYIPFPVAKQILIYSSALSPNTIPGAADTLHLSINSRQNRVELLLIFEMLINAHKLPSGSIRVKFFNFLNSFITIVSFVFI